MLANNKQLEQCVETQQSNRKRMVFQRKSIRHQVWPCIKLPELQYPLVLKLLKLLWTCSTKCFQSNFHFLHLFRWTLRTSVSFASLIVSASCQDVSTSTLKSQLFPHSIPFCNDTMPFWSVDGTHQWNARCVKGESKSKFHQLVQLVSQLV